MTAAVVIGHPDDTLANATYSALAARSRRVFRVSRWRDVRVCFGCDGGQLSVNGSWLALAEISLVVYRGIPTVHSALSARTREYAQGEWQAALAAITTLEHCPVLNSPYPTDAAGSVFFTTHGGRRRWLEERLAYGGRPSGCLSNLDRPPRNGAAFGFIAGGPATKADIEWSQSGLEVLSVRRFGAATVPFYCIVGQSVVGEKALDLRTGEVRRRKWGQAMNAFAERCAQALGLRFGAVWLYPDGDGGCAPGGFDLFPPQRRLAGDEAKLAAAICEKYGCGNQESHARSACAGPESRKTQPQCDGY
jgi:hypothetical protein